MVEQKIIWTTSEICLEANRLVNLSMIPCRNKKGYVKERKEVADFLVSLKEESSRQSAKEDVLTEISRTRKRKAPNVSTGKVTKVGFPTSCKSLGVKAEQMGVASSSVSAENNNPKCKVCGGYHFKKTKVGKVKL